MLLASPAQLSGTGMVNTGGLVSDVDLLFDAAHGLSQTVPGFGSVAVNLNLSKFRDLGAGYYGHGSLTIKDGLAVGSDYGYIGYQPGSSGTATIDGPGSEWTARSTIYVGYYGDGSMSVTNSGSFLANALHVGYCGNGTLTFSNGGCGSVTYQGYAPPPVTFVAQGSGSSGMIHFGPGGGTFTTVSLYASPSQLSGTGTINTGGLVSDVDLVFDSTHGLIQTVPGFGHVTVNLDMKQYVPLGVGYYGHGSLTIKDGLVVTCSQGYLGYQPGSSGTATVDGPGSTWRSGVTIGYYGNGTLNVTNGGSVSGGFTLGRYGGNGFLNVANGGSITGGLGIYNGTVTFSGGGYGNATTTHVEPTGIITFGPGGGTLTTGTLRASPAQLSGMGTINCRGLVSDVDLVFDASHGLVQTLPGFGDIAVTLDVSNPSNAGDLGAGYLGNGSLTIKDGYVMNCFEAFIGYHPGSNGTVTVDGPGSAWCSVYPSSIQVGRCGNGTLNVVNGGSVSGGLGSGLDVGSEMGSTGLVNLIDGSVSGWLRIAHPGSSGTVNQSGGVFAVTSSSGLNFRGGSGTYNLTGGRLILKSLSSDSAATTAFNFGGGTMQASGSFTTTVPMTLTGAGGDATVDTAGYAVTFSSPLSGPGGLNKIGDNTLTLSAANAYAGNTTVSAGTLLLSTIGSLLADVNDGHNSLFSVAPGARLDLYGALKLDLDDVSAFSGSWALVDGDGTTVYEPSFLLETIHGAPFLENRRRVDLHGRPPAMDLHRNHRPVVLGVRARA